MTSYAFIDGIGIALIAVMVFLLIRLWIKDRLERWGRELTQETDNRLRGAGEKLDSIQHEQQHLLSRLERLERAVNELSSRLSQPKSAA